jgi:hypothetical protein
MEGKPVKVGTTRRHDGSISNPHTSILHESSRGVTIPQTSTQQELKEAPTLRREVADKADAVRAEVDQVLQSMNGYL